MTPFVLLRLELEEHPAVLLCAESAEDEARLRRWLSRPDTVRRLADLLRDALDELRDAA